MIEERSISIPVGVILRRHKSRHRWGGWIWTAVALTPGSAPAEWRLLREEADAAEYHATTMALELHRSEAEAYNVALSMQTPSAYVILRQDEEPNAAHDVKVFAVTASPYEAQDFEDTGEDIVCVVPMSEGLVAWVNDFVERHYKPEAFKKRRRDRVDTELSVDGRGDPRIRQEADVYRTPGTMKPKRPAG